MPMLEFFNFCRLNQHQLQSQALQENGGSPRGGTRGSGTSVYNAGAKQQVLPVTRGLVRPKAGECRSEQTRIGCRVRIRPTSESFSPSHLHHLHSTPTEKTASFISPTEPKGRKKLFVFHFLNEWNQKNKKRLQKYI